MNLEAIKQAVRQATRLCSEVQRKHLVSSAKGDRSPVTIADYGAQAIISRAISIAYPDDAIIAEEQGEQFLSLVTDEQRVRILKLLTNRLDVNVTQQDVVRWLDHGQGHDAVRTWIIDPVDGTKGFLRLAHYAIGVGYTENGKLKGGVMGTPGYRDGGALFFALDGKAYCEPLNGAEAERIAEQIHVSSRTVPEELHIVQSYEKAHTSKSRMQQVRELAGLDVSILDDLDSMEKYARVACGDADLYLRLPREDNPYSHNVWDHAAGAALVMAAGGMVTDIDGSPLDFSTGDKLPNKGMIVSNGHIHERVLTAVQEVMGEG